MCPKPHRKFCSRVRNINLFNLNPSFLSKPNPFPQNWFKIWSSSVEHPTTTTLLYCAPVKTFPLETQHTHSPSLRTPTNRSPQALLDNSVDTKFCLATRYATVGWCVGYSLSKHADYIHAKLDRELMEYIRQHPEDFKEKDKTTLAEVLEDLHPIR
uniref:NADH dehydrogenase [ubiquinone] 1 subunit C2 n=1 Tax=Gopherus agassizii TaxID=38772 RepID=A0A452J379_9SAUR